jgi:hypothetical protein
MPAYDALHYDPPAPVAQVILRAANGATVSEIPLDTGAYTTLLPRSAIVRLGIKPDPALTYELIGFEGGRSTTQAVDLEMVFLQKSSVADICLSTATTACLAAMFWPASHCS